MVWARSSGSAPAASFACMPACILLLLASISARTAWTSGLASRSTAFPFAKWLRTSSGTSFGETPEYQTDRKSTRLNSSHLVISYAVFCLKKKNQKERTSDVLSNATAAEALRLSQVRTPHWRPTRRSGCCLSPLLRFFFFFFFFKGPPPPPTPPPPPPPPPRAP